MGVERVAHELGNVWGAVVFSLDVRVIHVLVKMHFQFFTHGSVCDRSGSSAAFFALALSLTHFAIGFLRAASWSFALSVGSSSVALYTLLRPRRIVTAHWHCFLDTTPGLTGRLYGLYQWFSLRVLPFLTGVVTTSPVLSAELKQCGCSPARVLVLPCCLSASQEMSAMSVPLPVAEEGEPLGILFIGRLDSYKRLDWLIESLAAMRSPWRLSVVGDGPYRIRFEDLAKQLFYSQLHEDPGLVQFHGRLPELEKQELIADQMCWCCLPIGAMRLLASCN